MLSGATSGVAGLLYVSRLNGISSGIEGGTYVLYAVAAAVIGGTSLFGGRGKMIHAVIGGIVIATIANGLALINVSPSGLYVVTGLVLLAAVTVDSVARSGSASR
jgi:D-xylose transport system permease protein